MTILLDSHAYFWWFVNDPRLSRPAYGAIEEDQNIYVSAVVAWEVSGEVRSGKWAQAEQLSRTFFQVLLDHNMKALPITRTCPFGRLHAGRSPRSVRCMLAAQVIVGGIPLVTADPAFRHFDVEVLW